MPKDQPPTKENECLFNTYCPIHQQTNDTVLFALSGLNVSLVSLLNEAVFRTNRLK